MLTWRPALVAEVEAGALGLGSVGWWWGYEWIEHHITEKCWLISWGMKTYPSYLVDYPCERDPCCEKVHLQRPGPSRAAKARRSLHFQTPLTPLTPLTPVGVKGYPLVNTHSELENGHRNSGFSHRKWWFSIAMLVITRGELFWNVQTRKEDGPWLGNARVPCTANALSCFNILKHLETMSRWVAVLL